MCTLYSMTKNVDAIPQLFAAMWPAAAHQRRTRPASREERVLAPVGNKHRADGYEGNPKPIRHGKMLAEKEDAKDRYEHNAQLIKGSELCAASPSFSALK